jgi:ADP-heptose:LPS heptosyltransferase
MEEKNRRHIAVLRFSALGDIAIAAPLVKAYARANPAIRFTMVSQPLTEPLFRGCDNLGYHSVYLKGQHKGVKGMYRLFRELRSLGVTDVADIHSVLRTFMLRAFFYLSCTPLKYLDKGRVQKAALTSRENKRLEQLPSTMSRYEQVLSELGLEDMSFSTQKKEIRRSKKSSLEMLQNGVKIGIAPFAKHKGKQWSIEKMEAVVARLIEDKRFSVLLFGGGPKEVALLRGWETKYSGVITVAGKHSFEKELEIISGLDLMVCMDSANMHFASAMGVPVISVWGATHPFLGFYGWNQNPDNAVMAPAECRPCSVFGNKECFRKDYICLNLLDEEFLSQKIFNFFAVSA